MSNMDKVVVRDWDRLEDVNGSEVSMKGFAMKASMSEIVSLRKEGDEKVGVKMFLAGGCREKSLSD